MNYARDTDISKFVTIYFSKWSHNPLPPPPHPTEQNIVRRDFLTFGVKYEEKIMLTD